MTAKELAVTDHAILRRLAMGMPQDSNEIVDYLEGLQRLVKDLKCCAGNDWICKEYEGYQVDDNVPDYRRINISCVDVASDFTSCPSSLPGMPFFYQSRGPWDEGAKVKYLKLLDGTNGLGYKDQYILLLQPLAYYANLISSGSASISIMSHGSLLGDRVELRQVEISCDARHIFLMCQMVRNKANNLIAEIKKANPDIEEYMKNSSCNLIVNKGGVVNTGDGATVIAHDNSNDENINNGVEQSRIVNKNATEDGRSKLFWIIVSAIVTGVVGLMIKFCTEQ